MQKLLRLSAPAFYFLKDDTSRWRDDTEFFNPERKPSQTMHLEKMLQGGQEEVLTPAFLPQTKLAPRLVWILSSVRGHAH